MTIDEAIKHAREVASQGCTECNRDHEQLAEWLEELKKVKQELNKVSQDLEVYKKALKLLAEDTVTRLYATKNEIIEHYLEKATEERAEP